MTTVPNKGTFARAEWNLNAAFDSIEENGQPVFKRGENLFVGYIPESQDKYPAVAYILAPPNNFDGDISRTTSGNTLFSHEIALFAENRQKLIELVDTVLAALRIAGFRASVISAEADGPGTTKQINLFAETN